MYRCTTLHNLDLSLVSDPDANLLSVTAGNPLFGWWELGSAITGNMDGHPSEADFSPATPKNEEAANLMHSAVPFALVAHR